VTFTKGQSGNPNGRMPGARGRATELVEKLMRDDAKDVVESVINAAKSGDMVAAKVVVDRLAPAPRGRFLQINVPKIEKPADALPLMAGVLDTMAKGELTPHEASDLSNTVMVYLKVLEMVGLAADVAALKETVAALQVETRMRDEPPPEAAA
jgi:polyhydroxyalkanoate synthesis regulator phasin